MTIKFSEILRQYDLSSHEGKVFLALTPSGPQFVVRNFFFRIIDRFFRRISYDLSVTANDLSKRAITVIGQAVQFENTVKDNVKKQTSDEQRTHLAEFAKSKLQAYEAELVAALKTIKIAKNLLSHSLEKRPEKKSHASTTGSPREGARSSVSSSIEAIAEYLGKNQGRSKIELLLEHECYPELMQAVVVMGCPEGMRPETLERILQVACDQKEIAAVISLIKGKVSSRNLRNIDPIFLGTVAQKLCNHNDDEPLSRLIDEQESVSQDVNLVLETITKKLPLSLRKFTEKGKETLKYADDEKNTLLHSCFLVGDPGSCRFLSLHLDPLRKNLFNQTPLRAMLEPKGTNASKRQIAPAEINKFIEAFASREGQDPPPFYSNNLSTLTKGLVPNDTKIDLIELFFLLGEPLTELPIHLRQDHLEASIPFLKKRYPKASLDEFFLSFFTVNKNYLKTRCEKLSLPKEAPKNVPLNALYMLFDDLPWGKIDIHDVYGLLFEQGDYPENPQAELRAALEAFIDRIDHKKAFPGSSASGKTLENFYNQIELCLRHSVALLIKKQDEKRSLEFLTEILQAAKYSEERCLQTITNQYRQIRYNDESTQKEFFERLVAGYRHICLERIVGEVYGPNSAILERVSQDLGGELGIIAPRSISDAQHPSTPYDRPRVITAFFEKAYTPLNIIYDYLLPLFQQDDEVREMYFALQRQAMPPTWKDEKYAPILDEIKKIHGNSAERSASKKAILTKYKIDRKQDERASAAVERDRRSDFLNTFVLTPQGDWNVPALIALLEQLGILSCRVEKAVLQRRPSMLPRALTLLEGINPKKAMSPRPERNVKGTGKDS